MVSVAVSEGSNKLLGAVSILAVQFSFVVSLKGQIGEIRLRFISYNPLIEKS